MPLEMITDHHFGNNFEINVENILSLGWVYNTEMWEESSKFNII